MTYGRGTASSKPSLVWLRKENYFRPTDPHRFISEVCNTTFDVAYLQSLPKFKASSLKKSFLTLRRLPPKKKFPQVSPL